MWVKNYFSGSLMNMVKRLEKEKSIAVCALGKLLHLIRLTAKDSEDN